METYGNLWKLMKTYEDLWKLWGLMEEYFDQTTKKTVSDDPRDKGVETITKEQYKELEQELYKNNMDDITEDILSTYRIESLADLPKSKYKTVIKNVRRIRNLRLVKTYGNLWKLFKGD